MSDTVGSQHSTHLAWLTEPNSVVIITYFNIHSVYIVAFEWYFRFHRRHLDFLENDQCSVFCRWMHRWKSNPRQHRGTQNHVPNFLSGRIAEIEGTPWLSVLQIRLVSPRVNKKEFVSRWNRLGLLFFFCWSVGLRCQASIQHENSGRYFNISYVQCYA